ncbi:MAG: lipoyl synthase [Sphingobacteriia bacterium]|nr:lipoyl synthase [Sphingobacteriia bacterium]
MRQKPDWLKIKLDTSANFSETDKIVKEHNLHTICSSGKCPNKAECWNRGTATFMILGDTCTRACKFCATKTGKPLPPDPTEPRRVAASIKLMKLKHSVITSVTRDDLADQGATHWAEVIRVCKEVNPLVTVEVLIPDFDGKKELIQIVADSKPDIIAHNIETVSRLTPLVRSKASYTTSLQTIKIISESGIKTKSGLMVGLGETEQEVTETLQDLYNHGCRIVTIGQYLQPSKAHLEVEEYIHPEQFDKFKIIASEIGFEYVESAPLVRSSYMAEKAIQSCH